MPALELNDTELHSCGAADGGDRKHALSAVAASQSCGRSSISWNRCCE